MWLTNRALITIGSCFFFSSFAGPGLRAQTTTAVVKDLAKDLDPPRSTDYLILVDVTNFGPTTDCTGLIRQAVALGPSGNGTVASMAIHPDQNVAYVVSINLGTFYQNEEEDAYLYAVDLCQKTTVATVNLTAAAPNGLGLPFPRGETIVAVRNTNLSSAPDRLYIGTWPKPGASNTDDGHILVFDISGTKKTHPALKLDFDLSSSDSTTPPLTAFSVAGLVAVPVNTTFLGTGQNDLKRNAILAVGSDVTDPDPMIKSIGRADRLIIFEDR